MLVQRLERVGERLGLSEALLGMTAALAADAPEITAAIAAITAKQQRLGTGVVIGSNVFNLAALLGLGALVAGRIGLHRRVIALGGTVAVIVAGSCLAAVTGLLAPAASLVLAVAALSAYGLVLSGSSAIRKLRLPARWVAWLEAAASEEDEEVAGLAAVRPARWPDVLAAAAALLVVLVVSVMMERSAARLGAVFAVPQIVTGGLVLAAVTSLPNVVAAVYLAARGRGAATMSTALNSNALNVTIGLLLPATITTLAKPSDQATLVAAWYAALTVVVLVVAYRAQGLSRKAGCFIIISYLIFAWSLAASAY